MKLKSILKKLFKKEQSPISYFSQDGQDKFLNEHVFNQKENGFFIEIGAHDGITYSNTYFFEKFKKWKGICIEPNPEVFLQLNKNRKSQNVNACISNFEGKLNYVKVTGYSEMLSGIQEFYEESHWQRLLDELEKYGGTKEIIQVDSYTLSTLLKNGGMHGKSIDYCSIDVEGAELSILNSIDFENIQIKVFSIENNFNTKDVQLFLADKGYELFEKIGADEIFIKK